MFSVKYTTGQESHEFDRNVYVCVEIVERIHHVMKQLRCLRQYLTLNHMPKVNILNLS